MTGAHVPVSGGDGSACCKSPGEPVRGRLFGTEVDEGGRRRTWGIVANNISLSKSAYFNADVYLVTLSHSETVNLPF